MIKCIIIYNENWQVIGNMALNTLLPIGTHLFLSNKEFIIVDYCVADYDTDNIRAVVRLANDNDTKYSKKFI